MYLSPHLYCMFYIDLTTTIAIRLSVSLNTPNPQMVYILLLCYKKVFFFKYKISQNLYKNIYASTTSLTTTNIFTGYL